jgi:hypothetical protein
MKRANKRQKINNDTNNEDDEVEEEEHLNQVS